LNSYAVQGRCAVVTGAARGIGYAVAERLLANGAAVAIWDVDGERARASAAELRSCGTVHAFEVDLLDYAAVERATASTVERLGHIDILVNNAGIAGPSMPLWEYPVEEWRRVVDVDLVGVFHVTRAVVPVMLRRSWGRIVNVASVAGKEGNPNMSAYSAAKAGVIALTKSLGKELATRGILVNCITPATVATEILRQFSEEQMRANTAKIPLGRPGTVEENANLIAWLCSPDCSFSTAATFDISGGRCTY
jgi:NAD(P)-dependent dehydrogenase (short-subunit alcohol dehydrogenase family)